MKVPRLKVGMDIRVYALRTNAALREANARILAGKRFHEAIRKELGGDGG